MPLEVNLAMIESLMISCIATLCLKKRGLCLAIKDVIRSRSGHDEVTFKYSLHITV